MDLFPRKASILIQSDGEAECVTGLGPLYERLCSVFFFLPFPNESRMSGRPGQRQSDRRTRKTSEQKAVPRGEGQAACLPGSQSR